MANYGTIENIFVKVGVEFGGDALSLERAAAKYGGEIIQAAKSGEHAEAAIANVLKGIEVADEITATALKSPGIAAAILRIEKEASFAPEFVKAISAAKATGGTVDAAKMIAEHGIDPTSAVAKRAMAIVEEQTPLATKTHFAQAAGGGSKILSIAEREAAFTKEVSEAAELAQKTRTPIDIEQFIKKHSLDPNSPLAVEARQLAESQARNIEAAAGKIPTAKPAAATAAAEIPTAKPAVQVAEEGANAAKKFTAVDKAIRGAELTEVQKAALMGKGPISGERYQKLMTAFENDIAKAEKTGEKFIIDDKWMAKHGIAEGAEGADDMANALRKSLKFHEEHGGIKIAIENAAKRNKAHTDNVNNTWYGGTKFADWTKRYQEAGLLGKMWWWPWKTFAGTLNFATKHKYIAAGLALLSGTTVAAGATSLILYNKGDKNLDPVDRIVNGAKKYKDDAVVKGRNTLERTIGLDFNGDGKIGDGKNDAQNNDLGDYTSVLKYGIPGVLTFLYLVFSDNCSVSKAMIGASIVGGLFGFGASMLSERFNASANSADHNDSPAPEPVPQNSSPFVPPTFQPGM